MVESTHHFHMTVATNKKTRNDLEILSDYMTFLTKTLIDPSSISVLIILNQKTSWKLKFLHFLTQIPFLVSCCLVRSFPLTKVLTGLPQILSSDWLMRRELASANDVRGARKNGQNNDSFGQISNIFESPNYFQLHNFKLI